MSVTRVDKDFDNLTLTLTADFDASIERVWELWADPRTLERWWGPPTYPATVEEHEFTPGGAVTYFMTGPEGDRPRGWWRITAVDPPRSLDFTDGFADQIGTPSADMPISTVQLRLTEHDGGTRWSCAPPSSLGSRWISSWPWARTRGFGSPSARWTPCSPADRGSRAVPKYRGPVPSAAADVIGARAGGLVPRVGVVLGSGLGPLADDVAEPVVIPYAELPGFPQAGVAGHAGRLVLGRVGKTPVALMQGRAHYYEDGRPDGMKTAVWTLAEIGCQTLVLTNAAGSLDPELGPGSVMLVSDHIGLTGVSPLFGENDTNRFVDMVDAYSPRLREQLQGLAGRLGIELREGVYVWFSGPQFETPAEIQAARILGGTAVGMSTVPEVILARRAGLEVAALSVITNLAAGMGEERLSHEHTMRVAATATETAGRLVRAFLEQG